MRKKKKDDMLASLPDLMDSKNTVIPIISSEDEEIISKVSVPDILPILTLRSSVLFPGAITPITVGREKSMRLVRDVNNKGGLLGAILQRQADVETPGPEDLYKVGTVARILKVLEMPNGNLTVILHGLEKFEIKEFLTSEPFFRAMITPMKDIIPDNDNVEFEALVESVKDIALNIINISSSIPQEASFAIKNIDSKRGLINFISSNIDLEDTDRQALLEAPGLLARARKLLEILIREQQLVELKNEIQHKVKEDLDQQQREYFLQQQMRTIQDELGGNPAEKELDELRAKAEKKKWTKEISDLFEKEMTKLDRMNPAMAEYNVQLNYLQLMLDLPWNDYSKDNLDLKHAERRLNADHFGLEEVKNRILEHLAVLKLKGDLKSPIICLYGPPGVGKTSLGKSVAAALKRQFGRISLGGLHDEAEIRGHRRTYIGAMPGRIIQTIRRAGTSNPVVILDEIDKVGSTNHGDPASALLEVLDPEQNGAFHDNYLDVDYDLSKVMFIATANNVGAISPALRDRMEMINVSGYLIEEKVEIAKRHLIPKQLEAHGVSHKFFRISKDNLEKVITQYTRESGVRALDKLIAKLVRYRAKSIGMEEDYTVEVKAADVEKILGVPRYQSDIYEGNEFAGVVTGLAWTEVGGDILFIESLLHKGKGGLSITGNLGDVMKESATIAMQWIRAHAEELGIEQSKLDENDVHIHVPEGATPKDGPSAGITMVTSLVSVFTGRKVKPKIAMTGETTLRGKVLPVGGVKEKILAAKRAGITDIILSADNRKDIEEIKPIYVDGLTFHYVKNLQDVLAEALM